MPRIATNWINVAQNLLAPEAQAWDFYASAFFAGVNPDPVGDNDAGVLVYDDEVGEATNDDITLSGNLSWDLIPSLSGNGTPGQGAFGWQVLAGGGDDTIRGSALADTISGETGNDSLIGNGGDDWLYGDEGNDYLEGGSGIDRLAGGDGNDIYRVLQGDADVLVEYADQGTDTVIFSGSAYRLQGNFENLVLVSTGSANLKGNALDNEITGSRGADKIFGMAGNDVLHGAGDADKLYGGDDNDSLLGDQGADQLFGGTGNDTLDGGTEADMMAGGDGDDTYVLRDVADSVIEVAGQGTDTVQTLLEVTTLGANVENLQTLFSGNSYAYGNALDNVMTGSDWNNSFSGDAGRDALSGLGGSDMLYGGDGNDTVDGGSGEDLLNGGAGDDEMNGGDDDDFIYGGLGKDTLTGSNGEDNLVGERGNDNELHGGVGHDIIRGDAGLDVMWGDAGNDTFVFLTTTDSNIAHADRIMDFVRGEDRIDLSAIDADTTQAGNQAFNFTFGQPGVPDAGDLYRKFTNLGISLEGDVNGDGTSDFRIILVGATDLQLTDLIL